MTTACLAATRPTTLFTRCVHAHDGRGSGALRRWILLLITFRLEICFQYLIKKKIMKENGKYKQKNSGILNKKSTKPRQSKKKQIFCLDFSGFSE
jgi:hypothetical protein